MNTKKQKVTQRSIAHQAKIKPDFLNHILQGRRRCPLEVAPRLETVTGIDRKIWVWGSSLEIRDALYAHISRSSPGNGY